MPAGSDVVLQARLESALSPVPIPQSDSLPQPLPTLQATATPGETPPQQLEPPPPAELPVPLAPTPPPTPPAEPPRLAIALDSVVDLTYYRSRDLDRQPTARTAIEPVYPPEAESARRSGVVRLQLKIEVDGRVSEVEVVESNPPGVFDASAVDAFRAAHFTPGQRAGRPVRTLMLIEVTYDWDGRAPATARGER